MYLSINYEATAPTAGDRWRTARMPSRNFSCNGRGSRSAPTPPESKNAGVIPAIAALPSKSLQNRRYQTSTGPVGGRKRRPGGCPFGSLAQERSTAGPGVDKIVINTHQCAPREMVARAYAFPFSWLFSAERRRSRSDRLEARHGPTTPVTAQPERRRKPVGKCPTARAARIVALGAAGRVAWSRRRGLDRAVSLHLAQS